MVDNLSKKKRSKVMASIRGTNTMPEMAVRKILWSIGKRYRVHDRTVFGTPDISHKGKKVAVFIDGCFWHGCSICYKEPSTNVEYWRNKIRRNKERRILVTRHLSSSNWTVLEFWEHQVLNEPNSVAKKISRAMQDTMSCQSN